MKISKKFMSFLFVGAITFVSCSSTGTDETSSTGKKSAIEQVQEYMGESDSSVSSITPSTAETPAISESTQDSNGSSTQSSDTSKKTMTCGKETVTLEYSAEGDKITLTDGEGKASELTRTTSASGEQYNSIDGKSIHLKGNSGVYKASAKAKEVTCKSNS